MTLLQARGQAPKTVTATDAIGLLDQTMNFVGAVLPKALAVAYFIAVCVILWRILAAAFSRKISTIANLEWIGLAIALALMR